MAYQATQSAVNVTLIAAAETTLGTAASTAAGKVIRRVSSSLTAAKDSFTSNEVRPDFQVADMRHGLRKVQGTVSSELSTQSYDDFLEALLRGTWVAGISGSNTDFTSLTASSSTSSFGGASGSFITKGFKQGDVVRLSGAGLPAANVGKNFRITALTATQMSVFPPPVDMTAQATFTLSVQGKKLLNGTQKRSFTLEQLHGDIGMSEQFTGCRVSQGQFKAPPNGMATVDFDFVGVGANVLTAAASPYFITPTAAPITGALAGPSGSIEIAGTQLGIVTSLDFALNNSCSTNAVVGSTSSPDVWYSRAVLTGNVSAYLTDASLIQAFLNESEINVTTELDALPPAGGGASDFLCFNMRRVKFSACTKSVAADGGVIATFPFQALLANNTANPNIDPSTIVIQRSN